jgi:transcription antitermination factor NusG
VRWAVLATGSQAEAWAETNLRQRGYQPFLPRYAARVRDRVLPTLWHSVARPLFPGYIFVPHQTDTAWRPIRYCPGIRANLIGGNGIQYANAADVEGLMAGEAFRRQIPQLGASWAPGAVCRLSGGVLAGHNAVVTEVREDFADVTLLLFGGLRTVRVALTNLIPRQD